MTDEQIIKAVDVCKTGTCRGCPYHVLGTAWCISILMKDVFDLINRQKAQIESLRKENKILSHDAYTAFQEGLNENRDLFKKEVEPEIRAEAYKEFAERLKETAYSYSDISGYRSIVVDADSTDNLIKEMTEVER